MVSIDKDTRLDIVISGYTPPIVRDRAEQEAMAPHIAEPVDHLANGFARAIHWRRNNATDAEQR